MGKAWITFTGALHGVRKREDNAGNNLQPVIKIVLRWTYISSPQSMGDLRKGSQEFTLMIILKPDVIFIGGIM